MNLIPEVLPDFPRCSQCGRRCLRKRTMARFTQEVCGEMVREDTVHHRCEGAFLATPRGQVWIAIIRIAQANGTLTMTTL